MSVQFMRMYACMYLSPCVYACMCVCSCFVVPIAGIVVVIGFGVFCCCVYFLVSVLLPDATNTHHQQCLFK